MEQIDVNQLEQMRQIEALKRQVLAKILSKEALERLGRIRSVNPELAGQVELYLLQIYQTGKLEGKTITDEQLKEMLKSLTSGQKKETKITRR